MEEDSGSSLRNCDWKRDSRDQLTEDQCCNSDLTITIVSQNKNIFAIMTNIMPTSKSSDLQPPSVLLKYTITSSSPHSGKYAPENIIEDKPMDQASRWSGAFQASTNQWITLELESLSVLSKYLIISLIFFAYATFLEKQ